MRENEEAWRIYTIVSGQMIMGQIGPVDINHSAIHKAMELYGIVNKRNCFEKVCKVSRHIINISREKHKK